MISIIEATQLGSDGINFAKLNALKSMQYNSPTIKNNVKSVEPSDISSSYVPNLYPPHKAELVMVSIEPSSDESFFIDGYHISVKYPLKMYDLSFCNIVEPNCQVEMTISLNHLALFSSLDPSYIRDYLRYLNGDDSVNIDIINTVIKKFNLIYIVQNEDMLFSPRLITEMIYNDNVIEDTTVTKGEYTIVIDAPYIGLLFFAKEDSLGNTKL